MAVRYDVDSESYVIESDGCPLCGQPLYLSSCDAPGCSGAGCENCGTGCDFEFLDDGDCAQAVAAMSDEERAERANAERAAFGLSPIE
jgi:hypothetical protein